jgi:antitoxin CptB
MLELDLVLATFLDRHFDRLDAEQRAALERLLEYPDSDLLDFVMGRAEPLDRRCIPLLELLRAA